jgi:hypothetical protein
MPDRDIEHHLPPLLRQAAEEHIPMTTDLTSAVRRQIETQPPRRPPGLPRAFLATVGAVIVVGLLITLLAHNHPQSGIGATTASLSTISGGPTPTLTALHCPGQTNVPAGLACPVTDQGITIQVTGANVSPLGTTIQLVVLHSAAKVHDPSILENSLSDGLGDTQQARSTIGNGKDPNHVTITLPYAPFPIEVLHAPLHLTFAITRMESFPMPPSPPSSSMIHGLWRSSFVVTPIQWTQYTIHMAPVVADGVSVQAQSLEVVPGGVTPQDNASGVRLDLTFTGVPAQTSSDSFQNWSSTTQVECSEGPCQPSIALLTLPGWQVAQSNFSVLSVIPQNTTTDATVGATGTMQVALIYGGTGTPNGHPATLQLNNLRLFDSTGAILRTLPNITLTMALG